MTKDEAALLKIAIRAGHFSEHFGLVEAQHEKGRPPYFSEISRNAIWNLHANAHRSIRYAWKRWCTYAADCTQYWASDDANENLYKPDQAGANIKPPIKQVGTSTGPY